ESGRNVQPGTVRLAIPSLVPSQALGVPAGEGAVGDQGAVERNAQLAAVRVPGDHQRASIVDHPVEHSAVRRVRDSEGELGSSAGRAGYLVVPVPAYMRVINPDQLDPPAVDRQLGPGVGQIRPTRS